MPPKKAKSVAAVAAAAATAAAEAKNEKKVATSAKKALRAAPFKSDTILMIVESPSKCKKISDILNSACVGPAQRYKVVASKGHLYEIDGLRAIDKKTYEPKYTILSHQIQTVEELRRDISTAARILLATDGDREGESIAYHICRIFDLPIETTSRVIFHEITPHAILEAVAAPTVIDMNLVRAQQARAVIDILVGYKLSPLLWRYIPKIGEEAFSAGRCQTPALRLVYDNHCAGAPGASAPAPEILYKVHGYFFAQNFPFLLSETFDSPDDVRAFLCESAKFQHKFLGFDDDGFVKIRKESAPLPLNTSAIIQACSNQLHISPKQTMQICQTLYQNGHITYMRTDNRKYSDVFIKQARAYIEKHYGHAFIGDTDKISTDRVCTSASKDGNDAAEAHEAIRPTHIEVETLSDDDFDARQKSVYRFIRNHTLESCMLDAAYDVRNVFISAPPLPQSTEVRYKFEITCPRILGWKVVSEPVDRQEMQKAQYKFFTEGGLVMPPREGANVFYQRIETIASLKARRHSHYTEASLVSELERLGIGRPSTYSSLVDVIQHRGYVKKQDVEGVIASYTDFRLERGDAQPTEIAAQKEFGKEKNKLVIQSTGIMTIEFLLKYFDDFFSYEYTSKMETRLDTIAHAGEQWNHICRDTYKTLKELMTPVNDAAKKHYRLDDHHEVVFSANGPVIKYTPTATETSTATDGDVKFKPVKKGIVIDVVKLGQGEYKLDDLVELQNDYLGIYEEQPMYIRNGRFGVYVEWGDRKESLARIGIPIDRITLADVDKYLNAPDAAVANNKNVLRIVTSELSVRKGKYGPYIFYKTAQMKEPKFARLTKEFRAGYMTCPAEDLLRVVASAGGT